MDELDLSDAVTQALVGDVDPERIDAYRFARGILPVFELVRSLFSQNELDTCLKLMLLHELSRLSGRATIERVRGAAAFLDPARVDSLVRSLKEGGWLELRSVDNTYVPSMVGVNLLSLLAAADLGNLSPQNALARAAQNAEFGARLDGGHSPVGLLLDNLHRLLENRVDEARAVLQTGRPGGMIRWASGEHAAQLDTIRGVLGMLEERLDAASHAFSRVVGLHEVMQDLVRMHTSIHTRLREWNLERLHSSEAGYSIAQLSEAICGADDVAFLSQRQIVAPQLPPSLHTDEVRARFHGARRRLVEPDAAFVYVEPAPAARDAWTLAAIDPAAELRARLTAALASSPGPLELEDWLGTERFTEAVWQLALLCRLEGEGPEIRLDDGRRARVEVAGADAQNAPAGALVAWLTSRGSLREVAEARYSRVTIQLVGDDR